MSIFKCKMCGGELQINPGEPVAVCEYCGTTQTLPRLDDDRRANLYDRANHFRRNNDFDKATGIYEQILNEDKTDAEAYWSLVLCRYGIEYVEDPATHKRVPTMNRAQYTSVFDDEDYKSAIQYADTTQRTVYEAEAKAINEIQKGILEISQKEEAFDVFICYKETDANGRRTPDSVLATDLYHQLTQEGFKVFFSRITLEDKLGAAYEPYIFAALNSAKVMVVLGTKPEYFNAVWVKNEWSRYLALIRGGAKKALIPAYRDMDPYDLPEEFSHLQAQDMSKLGFMQDLIRGVKKLTATDRPVVKETVVVQESAANTAPLLERAFIFLEDGDWQDADQYCEKVLDQDPRCAEAYLGKLMAELHIKNRNELKNQPQELAVCENYRRAFRFASDTLSAELSSANDYIIHKIKQNKYDEAKLFMQSAFSEEAFKKAAEMFADTSSFKDADKQKGECLRKAEDLRKKTAYNNAVRSAQFARKAAEYERIAAVFEGLSDYRDAIEQRERCITVASNIKQKNAALKKGILIVTAVIAVVILAVAVMLSCIRTSAIKKYTQAIEGRTYSFTYELDGTDTDSNKAESAKGTASFEDGVMHLQYTVQFKNGGTSVVVNRNEDLNYEVSCSLFGTKAVIIEMFGYGASNRYVSTEIVNGIPTKFESPLGRSLAIE